MARIIARKRGRETCSYYRETRRVKLSPSARGGKGPHSGASRVTTRDTYLGTAESIRRTIREGHPLRVAPRDFGLVMAAYRTALDLGIQEAVDQVVPQRRRTVSVGTYVLLMVVAKVAEPQTSWRSFGSWFEKTSLSERLDLPPSLLDAQNFWDAFDRILPEQAYRKGLHEAETHRGKNADSLADSWVLDDRAVLAIEEAVWQRLLTTMPIDRSTLLIDATNFFTYLAPHNPARLARTGHNKQGRHDKRQVALSMAVTRDGALPLLHLTYPGNRADAKVFPQVLRRLAQRLRTLEPGVGDLTLVFDRGHNSRTNLQAVAESGLFAVGGLILSQHPDLTAFPVRTSPENVGGIRFIRTQKEVYGQPATVLVTYSEKLERKQRLAFDMGIARLKKSLWDAFRAHRADADEPFSDVMDRILKGSRFGRYLEWEVDEARVFHVRRRIDVVQAHRREFGVRLLFTTRTDLGSEDILRLYNHDKQEVEQDFRQLKSPDVVRFSPIRHYTDSVILKSLIA